MRRNGLVAVVGLVALVVALPKATAYPSLGTVDAELIGTWADGYPGSATGLHVFAHIANSPGHYGDDLTLRPDMGDSAYFGGSDQRQFFDAFCVDYEGTYQANLVYNFDIAPLQYAPVNLGGSSIAMGAARAADIASLWGLGADVFGGIIPDYDGSGGDGLSGVEAAAFQIAIWEIATDSTYDLSSGDYTYTTDNDQAALAAKLLTAVKATDNKYEGWSWTPEDKLGALIATNSDNPDYQDFVAIFDIPVPEPTTAGLMLLGLLGLVARRRR